MPMVSQAPPECTGNGQDPSKTAALQALAEAGRRYREDRPREFAEALARAYDGKVTTREAEEVTGISRPTLLRLLLRTGVRQPSDSNG